MANIVKVRRGTAAELASLGALEAGQFGYCTDTHVLYIGDGAANHRILTENETGVMALLGEVLQLTNEPAVDDTGSGIIISATVDANGTGIGAALHLAADGHYEEADATAGTTAPCTAIALEAGTGTKNVLLQGIMRHDAWNWTTGPGIAGMIYLSITTGALVQTAPSADGEIIQVVGYAITDDVMMFNPQLHWIEHA